MDNTELLKLLLVAEVLNLAQTLQLSNPQLQKDYTPVAIKMIKDKHASVLQKLSETL